MSDRKTPRMPRSMRHKRILDAAAERPEASLEAIAEDIPTATADLVERVLEEYGDPAVTSEQHHPQDDHTMSQPHTNGSHSDQPDTDTGPTSDGSQPAEDAPGPPSAPDPDELSDTERETLRAIAEHPEATQREIATELDVADATVSNRVNSIEGFQWDRRQAFVSALFDNGSDDHDQDPDAETASSADTANRLDELAARIDAIEKDLEENDPPADSESGERGELADADRVNELADRVAELEDRVSGIGTAAPAPLGSAELTHKVVHACMASERITEDEELEILRAVLE